MGEVLEFPWLRSAWPRGRITTLEDLLAAFGEAFIADDGPNSIEIDTSGGVQPEDLPPAGAEDRG